MQQYVERGHLGGYVAGGDPATFYPELWTWLVKDYGIRSVVDVGCGEGHAVIYFESLGIDTIGIDGIAQEHPRVLQHDYTEGRYRHSFLRDGPEGPWRDDRCDLIWCCEFVEHIEERFIPNFLWTFSSAKLVLMTHAGPGQVGYHHVNCQEANYWIGVMAAIGFSFDAELTARTRTIAGANTEIGNHYRRSGLAFLTSAAHEKMHGERRS